MVVLQFIQMMQQIFFANFDWNETNSNIGTSSGSLFVVRNKDLLKGSSKIQTQNGTINYYKSLIIGIK